MSDRYLKILPYIVTSGEKMGKLPLEIFIILCDMADEDGYVVNPERFINETGIAKRPISTVNALHKLKEAGWIQQVEQVAGYSIWKIMLEPHQSANVKKFIVTDGSIEVTIKSVGAGDWFEQVKKHSVTTFNNFNWPTKPNSTKAAKR